MRELIRAIGSMVPRNGEEHVLVAIDGADGAGKSTFAATLASVLRRLGRPVIEASIDGFHHVAAQRYRRGRDSPAGFWLDSYDYGALRAQLVDPLQAGGSGGYRTAIHDVATDRLLDQELSIALPGSVLVLDGIFLHRDELAVLWDFSIYLDVPLQVSVARLAERDGSPADPADPAHHRYVEAQRGYRAACSPLTRASVVVDNTDLDRPFIVSTSA